jgi:UDP-N-acetylglucosamine--N-acetylmuramyl-(pentapeptide) pyrophosphoryl-undecaprenol N-acetylglucosamine transferase
MAKKNSKHLIILAAGGTAGHVFPAEALAAELMERGFQLALVTDNRGEKISGRLAKLDIYRVWAGGVAGKRMILRFISLIEIFIGTLQAWWLLRRLKPAVVIGFGGYSSVPTVLAASYSGNKTVIHEQNSILGRANCFLARRVNRIAISFEKVKKIPESLKSNTIVTGMPVRSSVISLHGQQYPNLDEGGEINITIFGGSQGASIFGKVVPDAIKLLDKPLRHRINIIQQCRPEDIEYTEKAYQELGVRADIASFFDDIPNRISNAHLVICRAGASTIAELTIIGRPAILVPYIYAADDHQSQNAFLLDEAGGGWLIAENNFNGKILANRITSLFSIPKILQNAGLASKTMGKPDATKILADIVVDLIPNNFKTKQGRVT